jgi:hypothetical protein
VVVRQLPDSAAVAFMTNSSGSLSPAWIAAKAIFVPLGDQAKLRMPV